MLLTLLQSLRHQYGRSWHWQLIAYNVAWNFTKRLFKMDDKPTCCGVFWHTFSKEFTLEKFKLSHEPLDDFTKSQWQAHGRSFWWLLYRWALAGFFIGGVCAMMVDGMNDGLWFIYLTNWGMVLCTTTSVYAAILVSIYYWRKSAIAKGATKVFWALHFTTLVFATVITVVYWLFIFPDDNSHGGELFNLWAHAFNSICMLLDHMLVAFPTRILHFIYPLILGLIYGIFTLIYYYTDGVDPAGNRYIYPILDWSKPGWAALTVFGCLLLMILFCFLLFGLYKLRRYIYNLRNNSVFALNV